MTNIKKSLRLSLIRVAKKMTRLSKNRNASQKVIKNVKMYRPCNKFRHKGLSTKIYRLLIRRDEDADPDVLAYHSIQRRAASHMVQILQN